MSWRRIGAALGGTIVLLCGASPEWAVAWSTGVPTLAARFEQDTSSVSFSCPAGGSWFSNTDARFFSAGSIASSMSTGCRATFTFVGTAVNWIGDKDVGNGVANVFLDGTLQAAVDTFSPTPQYQQVLFSISGLTPVSHTLVIEVKGTSNPASTGIWINVDAFDMTPVLRVEQDNSLVSYSCPAGGNWFTATASGFSGGTVASSMSAGCRATFTFVGTGVTWIGYRDVGNGIASVSVDGVPQATVDTYSPTTQFEEAVFSISGLPAASHTLTIQVTGTSNSSSTGTWVNIDAFDVNPAPSGGGSGGGGGTVTRVDETAATYAPAGAWTAFSCSSVGVTCTGGGGTADNTAEISNTALATATFTFTGTGVSWIGFHCSECGIAMVSIDGGAPTPVDTFASTFDPATVSMFSATGLTAGSHTLTIRVTGTSNPAATNTFVAVDAFDVTGGSGGGGGTVTPLEDTAGSYAPAGAWVTITCSLFGSTCSGGTAQASNTALSTATLSFTGTGVAWIGIHCPECGIAMVSIDGGAPTPVDTFAPTFDSTSGPIFSATGLPAGSHTFVIQVTGTSNPAATDKFAVVDGFTVTN